MVQEVLKRKIQMAILILKEIIFSSSESERKDLFVIFIKEAKKGSHYGRFFITQDSKLKSKFHAETHQK